MPMSHTPRQVYHITINEILSHMHINLLTCEYWKTVQSRCCTHVYWCRELLAVPFLMHFAQYRLPLCLTHQRLLELWTVESYRNRRTSSAGESDVWSVCSSCRWVTQEERPNLVLYWLAIITHHLLKTMFVWL